MLSRYKYFIMIMTGWDYVSELRSQGAYCSSSRWYKIVENHSEMMMQTKETSWFVYQSSLAILPAESSGSKQEEREKGTINLA
jgi:hypothetical protein